MPLFGKPKSPKELTQIVNDSLLVLNSGPSKSQKERKKAIEEIAKALNNFRELLTDKSDSRNPGRERDVECNAEKARINEVLDDFTHEIVSLNMLPLIISHMDALEFESCKHIVEIFSHVMRRQTSSCKAVVQYILDNPQIITSLIQSYSKPDCAIHCGTMLRDICRHESIAKCALHLPAFYHLFYFVQDTAFDTTSDAFSTLKDLLSRHKLLVADYLSKNYDEFFPRYLTMLSSHNYVTKRQGLKLLGELLLERHNFSVMLRYISDPENLKLLMNLLKSKQKQISYEAFHCFKVIAANPDNTPEVHNILYKNKDKLIEFLQNFQPERTEDLQFIDEKKYLMKQIRDLKPLNPATAVSSSSAVGNPSGSGQPTTTAPSTEADTASQSRPA